jgi:hypothetical protein
VLMPRKNGYEVCEAVKGDPQLRHIPVLLLTGTFEPFDAERSARVGADGTITKPFESQALIRQVNELLARSRPSAGPASAAPEPDEDLAFVSDPATAGVAPSRGENLPELDEGSLEEIDLGLDRAPERREEPARAPTPSPSAFVDSEGEFEFMDEPGEVLDLGEPTHSAPSSDLTAEWDLEEGPAEETLEVDSPNRSAAEAAGTQAADPAPDAPADDVWDLSDFEAVEEAAAIDVAAPEDETLWDDAAAEAIDLVENTSVDVLDEQLLLHDEPAVDSLVDRVEQGGSAAQGASGEREFELDETGSDLSLEEIPQAIEPPGPPFPSADQPLDEPPAAMDIEVIQPPDISSKEPPAAERVVEERGTPSPEPPAAVVPGVSAAPIDALSSLPSDVVRAAVRDAVEKVTWEAFSDLSETVIKAVQEKVEQIAWEVIPQMAEAIIKEEIKRLKEEAPGKQ